MRQFSEKKKLGLDPVYQFGFLLSRIHIVVYYIYCIFTILSGSTSLYIILYIYILFTEWLTWWNAHFQLHLNVDRKSRSSCISNQIFAQISLRIYVWWKQAYFHGGYYILENLLIPVIQSFLGDIFKIQNMCTNL